ncbi:MAG: SIMPL domain-containing protein [Alphaproteobacteria bacterium]|nr:SIMPL domain-containing protein [Alphaproteobacteria bacterium]NCQ67662.1 SIMPL domain-containing protein [Alphaproteobacteria bacterium]NCT07576.1 SIMPL domain-containing protein [Alphaproteobacteria bacterium]
MSENKSCKHTLSSAVAGLFIGAGVLGSGYFAADSFKEVKLANQMLTVKGFAEKDVVSDYAKWQGTLTEVGQTRKEVYERLMAGKQKLEDYLKTQNLEGVTLSFDQVYIYSVNKINDKGMGTNEIDYFNGSLTVHLESQNVATVTKISKDSEKLIQEGLNFESRSPEYLFSKLDEVKIELLGTAAKDAKDRASELSSKVGGSIGALRSAQQGVFQITRRNDTSTSGYGMYDTSSVDKTVKAVVTMSFAVSK